MRFIRENICNARETYKNIQNTLHACMLEATDTHHTLPARVLSSPSSPFWDDCCCHQSTVQLAPMTPDTLRDLPTFPAERGGTWGSNSAE